MRLPALFLLAATACAQDAKLDDYLTRLAGFGFSGVAFVAKGDKILIDKGYGLSDRKRGLAMSPDSIISIGSITKQFTAAAILKLEMQGKLKTTDSIGKFFPNAPADKQAITLHQLLTHTSGLRSDYAASDYEPYGRDVYMQRIFDAPLLSKPGETFRYANAGYSMLAAIVEIASGQPYERYLYNNLFEPSGMTMTGYKLPKWPEGKVPHGYDGESDWGTILERPWAADGPWWELRGNGGIHSTAMDMYRWHQALEAGKVLSPGAKTKFETGYVNEGPVGQSQYAYGWSIVQGPSGKLVEHNGGNRVFSCDFLRYLDAGLTIIVFSNTSDLPAPDFSHALARVALGLDYAQPPKPVQLSASRLAAYAGTYTLPSGAKIVVAPTYSGIALATTDQEAWGLLQSSGRGPAGDLVKKYNLRTAAVLETSSKGDYAALKSAFGGNAPPGYEQRHAQMWKRQQDENGPLQRIRILGTAPDGPGLATTAELTFEHGTMFFQLMWNPEGEIAAMRVSDQLAPNRYSPESESSFVSFSLPGPRVKRLTFTLDAAGTPSALVLGSLTASRTRLP